LERTVLEIAKIAFASIRDVVQFEGNQVRIRPFSEMSPAGAALIAEFTETDTKYGSRRSIKLNSKLTALDQLMKHFGGYINAKDVAANLSPEQLHELAATLIQKAHQSQTESNNQEDE
jgi:phage terminase small subunit